MMLPPFVGAIGFRQIFGQEGAVNALLRAVGWLGQNQVIDWLGAGREWGIVLLNALHLYPILYLNLVAALANVDPVLLEAAENLGCSGLRRAWRVTIPLVMPGIFAGGSIVFIWAFTELGVPLMFDYYRVTPVQIFNGLSDIDSNPFTYALVAVTLIGSALDLFCDSPSGGQASAGNARARWSRRTDSSFWEASEDCYAPLSFWRFALWLFYLNSASSSSPFSKDWYRTILPQSFTLQHYVLALGNHLTVPAIQNSLVYASLSTVLDLFLGVTIAYLITRTKIFGRSWLDALAMLPLAVPGLILAFGYLALTRPGSFLNFLDPARNPLILLVLAYAVRRIPYVVRSAAAGFEQASVTLEEAAQSLGASPFRALTANYVALDHGESFFGRHSGVRLCDAGSLRFPRPRAETSRLPNRESHLRTLQYSGRGTLSRRRTRRLGNGISRIDDRRCLAIDRSQTWGAVSGLTGRFQA